jgi:O-antigen ligase
MGQSLLMNAKRRIDFIFLLAYLFVDLVPLWGSVDIIGPQWLYVGLLNLGVLNYLWDANDNFLRKDIRSPVSFFYILYCLFGAVSIFFAFNVIESLVTYARTIITVTAFFNCLLLFRRSMDIFPLLARVITFLLLGQCMMAVIGFFADLPQAGLNNAIVNMKSGMGNKNVFAASIIIKLPFLLFNLYTQRRRGRFLYAGITCFVLYTLFLVNARASFMGLLLLLSMLLIFETTKIFREKKLGSIMYKSGFLLVPLLAAFLLSALTIEQNRGDEKLFYGTVIERLQSIDISTEYGTGSRKHIFESSLDMIRRHPWTGVGYGNWKLVSIPYETFYNKDAVVNYHSHNDFLETTAETGLPGGLSYLLIFGAVAFIFTRQLIKKDHSLPLPFLFSCMAMGGYFADAFLNFPFERTTMQVYFAFWLAVLVSNVDNVLPARLFLLKRYKFFIGVLVLLTAVAAWFSYQSFLSMRIQSGTQAYLITSANDGARPGFIPDFQSIPNLTQTALPVEAVKAEYLLFYDRYEEALQLLNEAEHANPYPGYNEYLKAILYRKTSRMDSAFHYAKKAFELKPLNMAHYQLLINICAERKDLPGLLNTYRRFKQFRTDERAWEIYQEALENLADF